MPLSIPAQDITSKSMHPLQGYSLQCRSTENHACNSTWGRETGACTSYLASFDVVNGDFVFDNSFRFAPSSLTILQNPNDGHNQHGPDRYQNSHDGDADARDHVEACSLERVGSREDTKLGT